ncbi:uncharacterized protein LOC141889042 isoform X2 [Acropora palmata]|uniref:uncharacterized protein LOC141889042 isoform X2 n=1 Tax=Acropora palmata TaxID=6131 RepID=UPI003DA097CA
MEFKRTLVFLLTCQLNCVLAASECTAAIIASVFGTIGALLFIAAIAALIWYCCKHRQSASLSSTSSAESINDPGFPLNGKSKGGDVGRDGEATVTFSHHYSEKAPSRAYNTSGAFDMDYSKKGEVILDMDEPASIKSPDYKGDVKIDLDSDSSIKKPSGSGDVKLDFDLDSRHALVFPSTSGHSVDLPNVKPSGRGLPGSDVDVTINGASKPMFDGAAAGETDLDIKEVFLERPGNGGFGLLIARDKTLPPPALFIREVTPGGIAANTGLVNKGDKILGINGVSIEGMPHEKAMGLLHDDTRPLLNLKLQKNAMIMDKDRLINLSGGLMEESCTVDVEPPVEASLPSVQLEALQGDAPDFGISVTEPNAGTSRRSLDVTDRNLEMRGPSVGLPKGRKSTKCLSCAPKGEIDEPYGKGSRKAGIDLDRPEVALSGRGQANTIDSVSSANVDGRGVDFDTRGSNLDVERPDVDLHLESQLSSGRTQGPDGKLHTPSAKGGRPLKSKNIGNCFSCAGGTKKDEPYRKRKGNTDFDSGGPNSSMEMKAGREFDVSGPGAHLSGTESKIKGGKFGAGASSSDVDFNVDGSNLDVEEGGPKVDMDVNAPGVTSPKAKLDPDYPNGKGSKLSGLSTRLNLPSSKKQLGNCFTCTGAKDKDEPYGNTPGNAGYASSGPKRDGSFQMKDISKPNISTNGADVDAPDTEVNVNVDTSSSQIRKPKTKAGLGWSSPKRKGGNCFSCAAGAEKDEPYQGKREKAALELKGPEFDGSLQSSTARAALSGPNVDTNRPELNVDNGDFEGPAVDVEGRKFNAKGSTTGLSGPRRDGPDVDIATGMSGPEFDAKGANIKTNFSEPESDPQSGDLRGPKASLGKSSAKFGLPSIKKTRPNCFSCAAGADKDEPYLTAKGQTFDPNIPDVDGSMKTGDISAGASGPGGKVPRLGMNVAKPDAHFSGPDADIQGPEVGVADPAFEGGQASLGISAGTSGQASGDLRGPKAAIHKPSAELGLPSTKKRRPNCFSCAGGADKDEPYLTAKGQTFDPNIPDVDGSMKPGDISAATSRPGGEVPRLGVNVAKPVADFSGPDADIQGPEVGVSGPNIDPGQPRLDVSGPDADVQGPEIGVSGPDFDAGQASLDISAGTSGQASGDLRGPKAAIHKPSAELGLPSTKKRRPNCFSCAGGADKDEPYLTAKGQTFDPNIPDVDGSMEPSDINASASGPGGKVPGLGIKTAKPDADFSGPKADIEGPEVGVSGPNIDAEQPHLDISRPDADTQGPEVGVSGPDIDAGQGSLDISAGTSRQASGDLRGPKASLHKPSAELGLPSTKKRRPNCFSCAGGADKDEPYLTAKGQTFDPNIPGVDGSMKPGDISAGTSGPGGEVPRLGMNVGKPDADFSGPDAVIQSPEVGVSGSDIDAGQPRLDVSGPDRDIQGPEIGVSGPDFDAGQASLDISAGTSGQASGDLRGPKASLHKPSAKLGLPSIKKRRPDCFSCAGGVDKDEPYLTAKGQTFDPNIPDVDGSMKPGDTSAGASGPGGKVPRLGMNVAKPDVDFSGPDADIQGPEVGVSGPNIDAEQLHLAISGPDADIQGPEVGVSGPDIDAGQASLDISAGTSRQASGDLRGPKVSPHKPSAKLGLPSIKNRRPNCFSCAGGADKDEPYLTAKGQTFDPTEPDVDGSMKPGDMNAGASRPGGKVPQLGMSVAKPDADFSGPDAAIQGPEVGVSGSDIDAGQPRLDVSGPDADIQGPKVGVSGPDIDAGQASLNISGGTSGQASGDLRGPKASLHKPSAELGLPSTKKRRPNCFSCAGGADKDEPYLTAKGQTFDRNIPDVDGSMKPGDISAGTSRPGGEVPRLGMDVAKPNADFSGPDADIQGPEVGVSGTNIDAEQPHLDISGRDADIHGPEVDVSGPEIDAGQASLDISAGTSRQASGDLRGPKVSPHKPSAKLGLPSIKNRRPNCFSCAGGADKDEPYLTAKGQTFDPTEPDVDGSMKPGDISAGTSGPGGEVPRLGVNVAKPDVDFSGPDADIQGPEVGVSGPNIDPGQPRLDVSGPDADVQGPEIGVSGPDFDAGQASLDISAGTSGQASGDVRGPKASLHKPSAKLGLPSIKKRRPDCFSCAGGVDKDEPYLTAKGQTFDPNIPDVDGSMKPGDMNAGASRPGGKVPQLGMKVAKPDADFSGPDAAIQGPEVGVSGSDIDAGQPRLDVSGPDADIQGPEVGVSGPDVEGGQANLDISAGKSGQQSRDLRGPKASLPKPSAELGVPSIKKRRPNCFSCAGGADKDEPYLTAKGQTFDPNIPDVGGLMQPGNVNVTKPDADFSGPDADIRGPKGGASGPEFDISAGSLEPGLDIRGSKPVVDVEGEVEVSTTQPVEAVNANFADMDLPDAGTNIGLSGPDVDLSAGKLQGPKVASDKPSVQLGDPSGKKKRANCFSCTGGADKDDPYITAKGGPTFDLNGPDVDGSMQPSTISADVSGPQVSADGLKIDVGKPDFEISPRSPGSSGPVIGLQGPKFDVQEPKTGISGPEVDDKGPNVDIPSEMSGPEFEFGGSKSMAGNGGDTEISTREADLNASLPKVDGPKQSIAADFSRLDDDATASTFHKSSPKLGLPSAKKNIPSCFSCAGGADTDDPYITKGKTFDLSHEADGSVQPGNINTPGLRMNADLSGPDVNIRGPIGSVSTPDDDIKRPNLDISAGTTGPGLDIKGSQPSVDNGGELELVAEGPKASVNTNVPEVDASVTITKTDFSRPDLDSASGDLKGPNASARKPSAELGLPSIKKKRPNCFSCAGGTDRDEPYITTKGKTSSDFSGPEFDGSMHPGDISTKMDVSEGDMTGFDVDANVPRASVPSATLDVSHVKEGMSEPEPFQFDIPGPGAGISGSNIDAKGPKIGVTEPDLGATGGDPNLSKLDLDVSGPTGKPNVGLDTSVETPEGKLSAKSSSLDVPKGNIKDPKATADMSTAELSMPSGKLKGGNCFSCATSPDKDEPYRKTKGKAPFSLQGPESNVGGQRDFSGTLPSIDSGKNLDAEGDVPGIELTTGGSIDGLDASISKPKEIEETDIPSGNIKGPSVSGRLPSRKKMRANCLSCRPDAEIDVPYGKRSGSIDLEGPKTDGSLNLKGGEVPELEATSPKLDLSSDLDLQTSKLDMSKGEEKLEVELNKPSFQIKSLDLPGASVGTKDTKLDIGQPGLDTDTSLGILGPKGTIDLDFNPPDDDLSATKPSMDKKEFGINVGTPHFGARKPDFDFSGKELEIEQSIGGSLDIDANFPDVNVQGRKPRLAMQETEMDPTDLNFDPNINPEGKASFKPAGSTFDSKFDGSLKNLTPKLRGRDTTLEHETRPLDGDIVVANDINLELQSTPEPFPSLDCQEPPSLQRHKIHSDMDLNVTPTPTEKPFSSGFNTGLDTDGSLSPTKTFNLNLGTSQKVEVELPKGKASEGKRDSSSSSSSSSSSESDSSTEDRPKKEKKKKSQSFKAFGKGSAGLASPKQGIDEIKKKGKDLSGDVTGEAPELKNKENSSKPIESSFSLPGTAVSGGVEMKGKGKVPDVKDTKSTNIPQSDVSLDADASFNLFLQDKVKEAKEGASSSSSSSSDEEDNDEADQEKKTKSKRKKKKKKWSLFGLLRKNSTSSESSKNDAAEQKDKEKESSSSSSSDEDEKKKKQQKDDTEQSKSERTSADPQVPKKFGNSNSSKLYQVEYFTNQQKYIIETPEEMAEPVVDVADCKGDGAQIPAVESRHTDTFIKSMKDASGGKLMSLSQDSHPFSHAKFTTAQEPSVVVVSRSLRKTEPQGYFGWTIDDHPEPQDANIHQTEPPVEGAYQLEYPYKAPLVKSTDDNQVEEAHIAPTAKLTSNISFEVAPNDKAPEGEEGKKDFAYTRENRFAPTWHLKPYFSQTEYRVAAPEKPVIDVESSDIQEDIPIVVRQFTKQISDTDGDQGESGQFVAISTNIVSSEPSSGFELEYPRAGKMFSTDSRVASRTTDEEWIVANSFQKENPDIAGLKASLNQLEEKTPPRRTESTGNKESKAISPSEKSSTNIPTRGSNSRLRELMQGYLIETPVLDDDETEIPSEKAEEQKKGKAFEDENSEVNPERTVFNVTLKSSKFETIHVPVQFDDKDITSVSRTDVASEVKVEFEGAVSGKKPDAGYKTEYSLPVSKDDDQDDPWMRHYSKGLQSRGFSFSKVPHVKEIKPNADEETTTTTTTTTRQTSEKRFQTETVSFQISKERRQTSKSNEDLEKSSAKSLRPFWDN